MVMEFVDHDVRALMQVCCSLSTGATPFLCLVFFVDFSQRMPRHFSTAECKCLLQQLLAGVAHLHAHWVIHRDLKASNLLYASDG